MGGISIMKSGEGPGRRREEAKLVPMSTAMIVPPHHRVALSEIPANSARMTAI